MSKTMTPPCATYYGMVHDVIHVAAGSVKASTITSWCSVIGSHPSWCGVKEILPLGKNLLSYANSNWLQSFPSAPRVMLTVYNMCNPLACCGSNVIMSCSTVSPFGEHLTFVCSDFGHVLQQSTDQCALQLAALSRPQLLVCSCKCCLVICAI